MNCARCGTTIAGQDNSCPRCGLKIRKTPATPANGPVADTPGTVPPAQSGPPRGGTYQAPSEGYRTSGSAPVDPDRFEMYMHPDVPLMAPPPPPSAGDADGTRNPWKIVGAVAAVVLILGVVFLIVYFKGFKPVSKQLDNNQKAQKLVEEAKKEMGFQSSSPSKPAAVSVIGTWRQVSPDAHNPDTSGIYYQFSPVDETGTSARSWSGTTTWSNSSDMISGQFKVDGNKVVIKWSAGLPDRELTILGKADGLVLEDASGRDFKRVSD